MAAQIVHAAGESVQGPLPVGTNAVVLEATNITQLTLIEKSLQLAGIRHVSVREIDPPYDGQLTAIGICPLADRKTVKSVLSELKLLGRNLKSGECVNARPSFSKEIAELRSGEIPDPGTICASGEIVSHEA